MVVVSKVGIFKALKSVWIWQPGSLRGHDGNALYDTVTLCLFPTVFVLL